MASMYTTLIGNETEGEKFVYQQFRNYLDDSFLIWHNIIFDGSEIDFVILHPNYGLWIVEVKDWVIENISTIDQHNVKLNNIKDIFKKYKNPLYQARENWKRVKEKFEKQDLLIHKEESIHQGKLKFPINYFVVFTKIKEKEFVEKGYADALPVENVIFSDFLRDGFNTEDDWTKKLINLRQKKFDVTLQLDEINLIKKLFGTQIFDSTGSTLDDTQTELTKINFNKGLLIEGPAGSGKSVVLVRRAVNIAMEFPEWKIGVFCFNALMASYLKILIQFQKEYEVIKDRIYVADFYDFVKKNLPVSWQSSRTPEDSVKEAVALFGNSITDMFDAVLIDEGQDCSDLQLEVYRKILKGNSFTFFIDEKQMLYTSGNIAEHLSKFGINIHKEKPLVKQQRAVLIILALVFYEKSLKLIEEKDLYNKVERVVKRFFGNIKDLPKTIASGIRRIFGKKQFVSEKLADSFFLFQKKNLDEVIENIIGEIKRINAERGAIFHDILIIFPKRIIELDLVSYDIPDLLREKLKRNNIPFTYFDYHDASTFDGIIEISEKDNRRKVEDLQIETVKIMTINTSKGFDARFVFIIGFDFLDFSDKAVQLGYVALTRTKEKVYCYYFIDNNIIENLKKSYEFVSKNESKLIK